jgi:hypothetical protein
VPKATARAGSAQLRVLVVLLVLVVGGCDGGEDPPQQGETAGGGERSSVETIVPRSSPPKSEPLQLEQRHPNGSLLRLTAIDFAPASTTLAIEAVNGYTQKIELNSRGVHLRDDVGNHYNFVEPEQNSDLEILPGATLKGSLVFLGIVDRRASSLRLLVNADVDDESVDLASRSRTSTSPAFQIHIPVSR